MQIVAARRFVLRSFVSSSLCKSGSRIKGSPGGVYGAKLSIQHYCVKKHLKQKFYQRTSLMDLKGG